MIDKTLSPFDVNVNKIHFFNIATGKSANVEITTIFLSIHQTGGEMRQKFTEECWKAPKFFEERINRHKLYTFQLNVKGK